MLTYLHMLTKYSLFLLILINFQAKIFLKLLVKGLSHFFQE